MRIALSGIRNAPERWAQAAEDAYIRARAAGAPEDLEYAGIGMYGVVLCDVDGRAWKVYRYEPPMTEQHRIFLLNQLAIEYEWLKDAARTRIADRVPAVYAIHPDELVLERDCVAGYPGGWGDGPVLRDLHREIERAMIPLGWTAPEFKEDSYILDRDTKNFVLVDITGAQRIGENLAAYVEDVLAGNIPSNDRPQDLAFFVVREYQEKALSRERAAGLIRDLAQRDPSIVEAFTTAKRLLRDM